MLMRRYRLSEEEADAWMRQDFDRQCDAMYARERAARMAPARTVVVPAGNAKDGAEVSSKPAWVAPTPQGVTAYTPSEQTKPTPRPVQMALTGQPISDEWIRRYCAASHIVRSAMIGQMYPGLPLEQQDASMREWDAYCATRLFDRGVGDPGRPQGTSAPIPSSFSGDDHRMATGGHPLSGDFYARPAGEVAAPPSFVEEHPVWAVVGAASVAASAFHGYRRNRSVGWALWWGLMGGIAPVITPAIAVAQGFGKRKGR
jgi:hypothetical protein